MIYRHKVLLAQGVDHLINKITVSPRERVNIDHVVAIVALKYPYMWPCEMNEGIMPSLEKLNAYLFDFANYLHHHDRHHVVLAEYAATIEDRGDEIRVVYGSCLRIEWINQAVYSFHKNRNCKIVSIHHDYDSEGHYEYYLDNTLIPYHELVSRFENWQQIQ